MDGSRSSPAEEPQFTTGSGIPVRESYGPEDLRDWRFEEKVGQPGAFPFTRGPYPTMYRGRSWTRRQVVGLGTAVETNERNRFVVAQGQTGISNDFDVPTLIGIDSDDPRAEGEIGTMGVAIDTLQDMRDLVADIDLANISVSQTINHPAPVLLAMYAVAAQERGFDLKRLAGTSQNDALKEFYGQKTFVFPPAPSVRLTCDLLEFCAVHMPRWNGININGYVIREVGATAAQEIAFSFAQAITYFDDLLSRGLDIDQVAPRFSFIFIVHNDFFEEVAKFRAARRVWANLLRDRYGATNPNSGRLRMHVQTAGSTMTFQQPEVNLIRGAIQAFAGACGGTQSMAVSCYDEALSIPSEKAQRLSLRTQQVIAHESGASNTIDPLAGSYYIESLTDELERQIHDWIAKVDARGGALACVEDGWLEQIVSDGAHKYQMEIANKQRIIVGVNEYCMANEQYEIETFRVGQESANEQLRRLKAVKSSRNTAEVLRKLDILREAAAARRNVMEPITDAVREMATEGEVIGALRDVFGEYKPLAVF